VLIRHDAATGIQRVVRSIWSHLHALDQKDFDVVPVYAGQTHGYCYADPDFLTRSRRHDRTRIPVGVRSGDKFLGLDLSAHYFPNFAEQISSWRSAGATIHMVVYDLLPLLRPAWFERSTTVHFTAWFDAVSALSDQILCISDQVSADVQRLIADRKLRRPPVLGRLYLSGDIAGSVPSKGLSPDVQTALSAAASDPVVLMVGTVEPRKGYDRALQVFERLWGSRSDAPALIIIGKAGWKTAALQERLRTHPESGHRLHWLEKVSDEALTRFYDLCRGVFSASYAEGFGLPVAEAAMHGKWVLARDLPVFREHSPANVRYFTNDSPDVLSGCLMDLIELGEHGKPPKTDQPTWGECVERLVEELGLRKPAVGHSRGERIATDVLA
jgi:glycosyltransferase involved in cell wall biosynthesis